METGNALERETWLKERGLVEESEGRGQFILFV